MIVYAESSAVLAWLLLEADGRKVEAILASADRIVSSDLTLVECDRAVIRATTMGRMTASTAHKVSADLQAAVGAWEMLRLPPAVIQRARQSFPHEPVRTLDALHVAWALHARNIQKDVVMLSLDERIRRVGNAVGLDLRPE